MKILSSNTKHISLQLLFLLVIVCGNSYPLRSNPTFITRSDRYHIVERGDTLFSISRKYSIPVDQLRLFNNLESDRIIIGQKIFLTPATAAKSEYVTIRAVPETGYHLVQRGETIYRISKMYDLEIMELMEYNNLASFDIQVDQKIWLIPGQVEQQAIVTLPPEEVVASEAVSESVAEAETKVEQHFHIVQPGENLYRISLKYGMTVNQVKELNSLRTDSISVGQRLAVSGKPSAETGEVAREQRTSPTRIVRKGDLHLPVNGRVISEFGIRNNMPHNGIDIVAPLGEPIYAALDGKVVFVGTQRGYGNVVVLEHTGYVMTVYAHNERNLVRLGETVTKGQPIATVGQSGNASGPHLHFEYRVRGKAINPREVLPDF